MTALSTISRKHVPTVPAAIKALAAMERELSRASTYAEIRKIIDQGQALKLLFKDIDIVKSEAEDVILAASARIGEEIGKVPKAPSGRAAFRELTQGDKKERRAEREHDLGIGQTALPDKRYGVIYADPPWRFQPYSDVTGMDRAADNHYPTTDLAAIMALQVPAADDAILFLWATVPMLPEAMAVMAAWGFGYKSSAVWIKDKLGTGYWWRNRHELLLVGTKGKVPAPAPGEQYHSVIYAPVGAHSAKPFVVHEIIKDMFPTLPRIELFARERFEGWDIWGNEVEKLD